MKQFSNGMLYKDLVGSIVILDCLNNTFKSRLTLKKILNLCPIMKMIYALLRFINILSSQIHMKGSIGFHIKFKISFYKLFLRADLAFLQWVVVSPHYIYILETPKFMVSKS